MVVVNSDDGERVNRQPVFRVVIPFIVGGQFSRAVGVGLPEFRRVDRRPEGVFRRHHLEMHSFCVERSDRFGRFQDETRKNVGLIAHGGVDSEQFDFRSGNGVRFLFFLFVILFLPFGTHVEIQRVGCP